MIINARRKFQSGFTFIEMMVVISVLSVLGTIGMAAFYNYNQEQVFQAAVLDVVTVIKVAKSRAQSQVVPPSCTLLNYAVAVTGDPVNSYELRVTCAGDPEVAVPGYSSKKLPSGLRFTSSTRFDFPILTGEVQVPRSVTITNGVKNKMISVDKFGGVRVQ